VTALHATSDAHGHLTELTDALRAAGLVDAEAHWSGGDARLWFLGDFLDRGPDGLGVIALVRRLSDEAPEAGGFVGAVLGNHEVLALGMKKFGDTQVSYNGAPRTFAQSWVRNGGLASDQAGIDEDVFDWLRGLPVVARDGDHLLMHSDTMGYLAWGQSIETINQTAYDVLAGDDIEAWFDLLVGISQRHDFHTGSGPALARELLDSLGGRQIVHGHSIIGDLFDEPFDSYTEPRVYCDGLVIDIDGGIYEGGPCLVARLA